MDVLDIYASEVRKLIQYGLRDLRKLVKELRFLLTDYAPVVMRAPNASKLDRVRVLEQLLTEILDEALRLRGQNPQSWEPLDLYAPSALRRLLNLTSDLKLTAKQRRTMAMKVDACLEQPTPEAFRTGSREENLVDWLARALWARAADMAVGRPEAEVAIRESAEPQADPQSGVPAPSPVISDTPVRAHERMAAIEPQMRALEAQLETRERQIEQFEQIVAEFRACTTAFVVQVNRFSAPGPRPLASPDGAELVEKLHSLNGRIERLQSEMASGRESPDDPREGLRLVKVA